MKKKRMVIALVGMVAVVAVGALAADNLELIEAMESGDMKTAVALAKSIETLEALEDWTNEKLYFALKEVADGLGFKANTVMWAVRIAATGTVVTPGGATDILEILGKEESLKRLKDVSNILDAVAFARNYNKGIGNAPMFYLKSIAQAEERGKTCWKGSYVTMVGSDWRPYPAELFFKVYPSGRVAIVRENRRLSRFCEPKFSYNNYIRHFQIAKPDVAGVTSVEDSDDWPVLLRLKSGTKTVREVSVADLVETGVADFKKRIAQADKIVIRDGTVKWDKPTDKDPVLRTITDPKEITAFNKMFVFVEKAKKSDWRESDVGQPCRCEGGPGIDWWKGGEKLAQTALHHGMSLWWDGFTWDFFLTPSSKVEVAKWFASHSIDLKTDVGRQN